jgi:hypothetical protein
LNSFSAFFFAPRDAMNEMPSLVHRNAGKAVSQAIAAGRIGLQKGGCTIQIISLQRVMNLIHDW